jgi:formate hydrogenlyase transcriptional activator
MGSLPTMMTFMAGVALSIGVISFLIGLHKHGDKTDVIFGILCILQFMFLIVPPAGLVAQDEAPYSTDLIIKRFFGYSFSGLFPWFVYHYTGFKKRNIPVFIGILAIICYALMAFTTENRVVPLYLYPVLFTIGLIIWHGFLGVRFMIKNGEKQKASGFRLAMYVFLFLYVISSVYQLLNGYFSRVFHQRVFFPVSLFPFAFIVIMGIRLRTSSISKFRLEKALGLKNQQWESLLNNIQLIVVHLDSYGKIIYINPYGVNLLQYKNEAELIGKNWFDYFLPGPETSAVKKLFETRTIQHETTALHKNIIVTREGFQKVVTWNNEQVFDEARQLTGILSIGSDITEREQAFQKIQELKSELEKENLILRGEPLPEWMSEEIIGTSQAISYAIQKAGKVANSQASVLLEGETGVGKEMFANMIQLQSARSKAPFVKVNCGALPSELIEDELFGHEKGAFTGALQSRKGRFEVADGGTIFLDEIGELPLSLQPKLLRVLQNGEFERVGGQQTIKVDVRIIAATNRDLELEVKQGRFRDDLYYRLNVYPITIPSLRGRKEDIPMLVQYFVDKISNEHNKTFKNISKSDMNHLSEYSWPGNIRELRNVIERSVISSDHNGQLRLDWFYSRLEEKAGPKSMASLEDIEREHIIKVLQDTNWRISGEDGAAVKLVMNASTLRSRIKKLNIIRPSGKEIA